MVYRASSRQPSLYSETLSQNKCVCMYKKKVHPLYSMYQNCLPFQSCRMLHCIYHILSIICEWSVGSLPLWDCQEWHMLSQHVFTPLYINNQKSMAQALTEGSVPEPWQMFLCKMTSSFTSVMGQDQDQLCTDGSPVGEFPFAFFYHPEE